MFENQQQTITLQIQRFCQENQLPNPGTINWQPVNFSGVWGIATNFFPLAAQEARSGKKVIVPQRAQELAELVADQLGTPAGFERVEAVKGYLNLYYSSADFSQQVVDTVLEQGPDFGRGEPKDERVRVVVSHDRDRKGARRHHVDAPDFCQAKHGRGASQRDGPELAQVARRPRW